MVPNPLLAQLVIEQVSPRTVPLARTLILEGLQERVGILIPGMNPDLDDILSFYSGADHLFLIGYLQDSPEKLICTGALVGETKSSARIVRVSVQKRYRRNKIAGAIVRALESHAKNNQINEILLETTDGWDSAILFYLSLGYQIYTHSDGNCHMKKRLDAEYN
ncbi:MAG: GNAT family N-acetyltransferase [Promethearchaeota archaeon]